MTDHVQGAPSPDWALSSRESILMKLLGDHYSGVYFVQTLEGFIHNFNSPLQILWIRSEQIRQDIQKLHDASQQTGNDQISDIASRMKQRIESWEKGLEDLNTSLSFLTKDIVTKRRSEVDRVQLNEVLTDTFFLLKADMFFKHQVETELKLYDHLPKVKGRYSDFCIIAMQLIQNALEAMVQSETKHLQVVTDLVEDRPCMRVRDSGVGISVDVAPRIFDPFFSTRASFEYNGQTQHHPGLGLTHVTYLIQQYTGEISFKSSPGETIFTVLFPPF